jgi:phage terminase small subunit
MGRNRKPAEIQRLRGNPRKLSKRQLQADQQAADPKSGEVLPPASAPSEIVYPEFLTDDRERAIFRLIIEEFMPRNLARETDFNAYARYAVYMRMWIEAKEQLEAARQKNNGEISTWYKSTSKHGELLRRNPAFQDMIDLGHELRQMEPQLALTPLARNAIYSRFAGGGADPGDLFPTRPADKAEQQPDQDTPLAPAADSPLGALSRVANASGRPN